MKEVVTKCHHCGHVITEVRNPIRRTLSEALVYFLYELTDSWFRLRTSSHFTDISMLVKINHERISSDYTLLISFGLIARVDAKAGHYLPTQRGIAFLLGKHSIPKYVGDGLPGSVETIMITDVLKDPPKCNWEYYG